MARKARTVTLSYVLTVPASTQVGREVTQEKRVPIDGKIIQITLFFPAGSQGTGYNTSVFFMIEGTQVWPLEEGTSIALEDTTIPFYVDIDIEHGERLIFKGSNTDATAHTIRAVVTIAVMPEAEIG